MRRGTAVMLAALMTVFGALPVLAGDRGDAERIIVDVSDHPVERRVVDGVEEGPVGTAKPLDRGIGFPVDRKTDGAVDRIVDRPVDRVVDRYRCVDFVTDRRCIDDHHPHVSVRHLIQRLIHAGEWEKLFRLLHRLGII